MIIYLDMNEKFDQELNIPEDIKYTIFTDFDSIAMKTLKKGDSALLYYCLKLQSRNKDVESATNVSEGLTME